MFFGFHARAEDYCCKKNKVCMKSCLHFYEKNIKSYLLGSIFFQKMVSFKLQFTCFLYDAVNWKNKLSLKFYKMVDFYVTLKICIFKKESLILKIGLKLDLMQT